MTHQRTIRIATRASQLALWQANDIAEKIRAVCELPVELIEVSTIGDRDRQAPLAAMGGMGVFTKEVQRFVIENEADLAVHSLKDLPTESAEGLTLACVPERAPRFDALLLPGDASGTLDDVAEGARIGTGSLRRQSQLLSVRPDLEVANIRGNVETRIQKLNDGEYDAIILAEAGLRRLGMEQHIASVLSPPVMYPAVGQAALGIECRADDVELIGILLKLSDSNTLAEVLAERGCLRQLRAGCHAPVGTLTKINSQEETLTLDAVVLSPDGRQRFHVSQTDKISKAEVLGEIVADELIEQGAMDVIE